MKAVGLTMRNSSSAATSEKPRGQVRELLTSRNSVPFRVRMACRCKRYRGRSSS